MLQVLSSEESSLPTDEDSDPQRNSTVSVSGKRKVRRRHKASELQNRLTPLTPRSCVRYQFFILL